MFNVRAMRTLLDLHHCTEHLHLGHLFTQVPLPRNHTLALASSAALLLRFHGSYGFEKKLCIPSLPMWYLGKSVLLAVSFLLLPDYLTECPCSLRWETIH